MAGRLVHAKAMIQSGKHFLSESDFWRAADAAGLSYIEPDVSTKGFHPSRMIELPTGGSSC